MTKVLTYLLVADGTSDRALLPIVRWSLRRLLPNSALSLAAFVPRASKPVGEVVEQARASYRPALIFVHRDAEKQPLSLRRREIPSTDGVVAVIPVRMTEAWLLIDEAAIRRAAGNPNGTMPLTLPDVRQLEHLPAPKDALRSLLMQASGLKGRRLERFNRGEAAQRVSEYIRDFSVLRNLSAYKAFSDELQAAVASLPVPASDLDI
jgi:hypothetical protein